MQTYKIKLMGGASMLKALLERFLSAFLRRKIKLQGDFCLKKKNVLGLLKKFEWTVLQY